jgi:hypothetical protein
VAIKISQKVAEKLAKKHEVTHEEIIECFTNRTAGYLLDIRAEHKTDPDTRWFVAQTNRGRTLKVVFIRIDSNIHIRTAYEPNSDEIKIYSKLT